MIKGVIGAAGVKGLRTCVYGPLAELVYGHVRKGSRIGVIGHIQQRRTRKGKFVFEIVAEEVEFLEKSFVKTLDILLRERRREGYEIAKELRLHLKNMKTAVSHLDKQAKKQPALIRKKLKDRLNELGQEGPLSEEKIAEEASFLAQRHDLAEEIARLKSHLQYFSQLLSSDVKDPVGKRLDFVTQELFRETNTINSKAQNISIVKEGLTIKGEIESIRQQVQNLE